MGRNRIFDPHCPGDGTPLVRILQENFEYEGFLIDPTLLDWDLGQELTYPLIERGPGFVCMKCYAQFPWATRGQFSLARVLKPILLD